jgi:hypothetical protein
MKTSTVTTAVSIKILGSRAQLKAIGQAVKVVCHVDQTRRGLVMTKEEEQLCHPCRILKGWKARDNGAHTARAMECSSCQQVGTILPARHWVKDDGKPNSD